MVSQAVLLLEQVTLLLFLPAKLLPLLLEQPTRADVVANVLPNAVEQRRDVDNAVAVDTAEAIADLFLCYKPLQRTINKYHSINYDIYSLGVLYVLFHQQRVS